MSGPEPLTAGQTSPLDDPLKIRVPRLGILWSEVYRGVVVFGRFFGWTNTRYKRRGWPTDGKVQDWFCAHCAAHHMRGNADAIGDREPDECECPPERWVS